MLFSTFYQVKQGGKIYRVSAIIKTDYETSASENLYQLYFYLFFPAVCTK